MSAAKLFRILVSGASGVLVAIASAAAGHQNDRNAFELLARTMRPTLKVNVVAITKQRDPASETAQEQVKLVRSKDGKQRWTVLQPMRLAGVDCVDDGIRRKIYIPDLRQVNDMESASKGAGDYKLRVDLARRNYTYQISARPVIAGRETLCVTATPKNSELEIRKYYIDPETDYPLRVETIGDDGRANLLFETQFVEYPLKLDSNVFKMSTLPGVKVFQYSAPVTMNRKQAQTKVGFVPLVPGGLPMGFKVQGLQFNENPTWRSVMVRLTDGLAQATVYQWKPDGNDIRALADSTSGEYNGIKLLIVSNTLGPKIRAKLLQAFVSHAISDAANALRIYSSNIPFASPLGPELEPTGGIVALKGIDDLLGLVTFRYKEPSILSKIDL